MKKITMILAAILIFTSFSFAANGFKEGNKLYLGGKYQDALNQYQDFIQKNPDYYEGYFNAGNALFRQEQYDGALGMYKKAQELNPKDPDVQYNIDVTQKKLEEKKNQNQDQKNQDKNKQNQQGKDGKQNQQGKNGQQKQQQGKEGEQKNGQQAQQQQGQQAKKGQAQQGSQEAKKQPPSGMTEDEVQALLNQKQNQEKQLQGYFGKQNQGQGRQPDMFNMSPEQIMQYMMQRQMDPFAGEPQQKQGGGEQKDW